MFDAYMGTVQYIDNNRRHMVVIGDDRTIHAVNLQPKFFVKGAQLGSTVLKAGDHVWLACTSNAGLETAVTAIRETGIFQVNPIWRPLLALGKTRSETTYGKGAELETVGAELDTLQEDLRNQRQNAQSAFKGADQRTTQLMNILGTIVKTLDQERGTINRALS